MTLSQEELNRYSRNLLLSGFGTKGQEKLKRSKVLVIGAGGLGSSVLLYLAAAGAGSLTIVDSDDLELSNLNRQVIHKGSSIGTNKALSAKNSLSALNSGIQIKTITVRIKASNAEEVITGHDIVVDCTDNFASKFIINDSSVKLGVPLVHAAAVGYKGQAITILPGRSACYRCVFKEEPSASDAEQSTDIGILGAAAGLIGTVQASETIKYLTGSGELLTDKLFIADLRTNRFRTAEVAKDAECKACGGIK